MKIAAECRGFRALTLYFSASSCWYAWFIALSSHFATFKSCVAFGDAIPPSLLPLREHFYLRTRLTSVRYYWHMDLYLTVSLVSGDTSWNVPVPLFHGTEIPWGSAEQKLWPNRSLKFSVSFLPCWLKLCTMVVISVSVPMAKLRQNDHILCRRAVPCLLPSLAFRSFLFSFSVFVVYLNFKASLLDWRRFKLVWCPWLNSIFVFKMKPGWATTKLLCVPWLGVCCVISSIHNRGVF